MEILATGLNYSTGQLLVPPIEEQAFGSMLEASLVRNINELRNLRQADLEALDFRGVKEAQPEKDINNPRESGWTFLINSKDPHRNDIVDALQLLAVHRGMKNIDQFLSFNGEPMDKWSGWLEKNYNKDPKSDSPHYILIVGGPEQVPFGFQSYLSVSTSVGRVTFDSVDDLRTYTNKVLSLERKDEPVVNNEAVFFATDGGWRDPTHYSCKYMVSPLADEVKKNFGTSTSELIAEKATKKNLTQSLIGSKAALVYTASHGLGAPDQSFEVQKRLNGAICCQKPEDDDAINSINDELFTADDIPSDPEKPFLEGAIIFQFACFGYGTPRESVYNKWLSQNPKINSQEDFVAALPKKLLAHPKGPIGFIGHVDLAWLHGFDDPEKPDLPEIIGEKWNERIKPFYRAVENLLRKSRPVGRAMSEMSRRLASQSELFASRAELLINNEFPLNSTSFKARMATDFVNRNDSKNYMIFGDPAARPLMAG